MKNILLFLTSILFISCTQEMNNDLKKSKLNGPIKSITTYTFKQDEKTMSIDKESMHKERSQAYNQAGNLTEDIWYISDGTAFRTVKYHYDNEQKIQEHIVYNEYEEIEAKLTYTYNKNNLIEEHLTHNSYGDVFKKVAYTYNAKGELIQQDTYEGAGTQFTHTMKVESEYDENGDKIKKTIYRNGNLFRKYINKYDEHGNEVEARWYNEKGKPSRRFSYQYPKFDNYKNWEQRITKGSATTKPKRKASTTYHNRVIEYY